MSGATLKETKRIQRSKGRSEAEFERAITTPIPAHFSICRNAMRYRLAT